MPLKILALLAATSLAVVACKKVPARRDAVPDRPSLAVPLGGGPMSVAGALNELATSRCQREELCGRVGKGKTHRDLITCERTELQAHANDVSLLQCKAGIDGKRLETCGKKLQALACDHEEASASEVCGDARLCLKE